MAIGTTREAEQMGVHCSPFGVIPKKGKAGRWRLIVDLSSPDRGGAANFKVVRPGSGCGLGVALFQLVIAIMTIIIACLSLSSF